MYPKGYTKYVKTLAANGTRPPSIVAKFATRYKFAGQINSLEILGASDSISEAYLLCLRLSLAYSALETLESAVSSKNIPLKSAGLAKVYKSSRLEKFRAFLVEESDSSLRGELKKLAESKNDSNLNPVIRALRHTMFHGTFNPTRAGITTKTSIAFIRELEKTLFLTMESRAEPLFVIK